jgi:DNA-binding winged helix-turn-helix (wHTH) protein/Tfp pilus assembly protein PilF
MPPEALERYRFDLYEYVASTGYLYRKGYPVRLSEQQGRLLQALLLRAGQVVTPEEIRIALWPGGEHLDHNHAIRNAINQLRAILRDKPQNPRFIETLPKRGYRFIAEVSTVAEPLRSPLQPSAKEPPELEALSPAPFLESSTVSSSLPIASEPPTASQPQIRRSLPRHLWLIAASLLLLLSAVAFFVSSYLHRATPTPAPITVGIAPIDASGPAAQQIAEPFRMELMDAIAQLPGVEVRATHSFPADPAGMSNLHAVAQKLQLDALLLGRIEAVDANHFNFIFELVRGSDAVHLASFHYSGTASQLGTTRDHIQRDLFYRLSSVSSQRLRPVRSTDNSTAYSQYLSGRADLIRHDDASIQQAVVNFRKALALDPSFAQAWAGLGSAYLLTGEHTPTDRESSYAQARAAALKAISLNPDLGEAHATLGFLDFRHDWNPAASEVEFRRAIELDPNQAMHRIMYALLLCNTGRSAEAFEQIARAHDADPFWPPIYITEMYVASAAGKNDLALQSARKLLDFLPDWPLAYDQSAWAFWYAARYEDAVHEWMRMAELEHDTRRLAFERRGLEILHAQGVTAYSRYKLQAIQHPNGPAWNHPNDFQLAEWQINAGQDSAALTSMRQMVQDHDPEALQFAASPAFLPLHNNPNFRALLTRIGLPHP